jgi:hypothetical protein
MLREPDLTWMTFRECFQQVCPKAMLIRNRWLRALSGRSGGQLAHSPMFPQSSKILGKPVAPGLRIV